MLPFDDTSSLLFYSVSNYAASHHHILKTADSIYLFRLHYCSTLNSRLIQSINMQLFHSNAHINTLWVFYLNWTWVLHIYILTYWINIIYTGSCARQCICSQLLLHSTLMDIKHVIPTAQQILKSSLILGSECTCTRTLLARINTHFLETVIECETIPRVYYRSSCFFVLCRYCFIHYEPTVISQNTYTVYSGTSAHFTKFSIYKLNFLKKIWLGLRALPCFASLLVHVWEDRAHGSWWQGRGALQFTNL